MKARVAGSLLALSTLLMGAAPEVPPYAARIEGFVGANTVSDLPCCNDYAFNVGGTGSAAANFGAGYLQADVFGDWTNNLGDHGSANFRNVGVGGHLGIGSQTVGILGIAGSWQDPKAEGTNGVSGSASNSFWRIGLEGDYFLDQFTAGVRAGYATFDVSNNDGYYVHTKFRYYVTDDFKFEGTGGVIDSENSKATPLGGVLAEYRVSNSPFSVFARWEGSFNKSVDEQLTVLGATLYFDGDGATLKRTDRAQLRDACTFAVFGSRLC